MERKTLHTVVFKAKEGGGNPCPVTLGADGMCAEDMRLVAAKYGEESAFILEPQLEGCDVKARYFVPNHEMEMCVHATIGSAVVLVEEGICTKSPIIYETFYGPTQVDWEKKDGKVQVAVHQFLPKFAEKNPSAEEVCKALKIEPSQLASGPIQSAATTRFKLMVPLASKEVLYNLQPDFEYLWSLCDDYKTTGFYPFAIEEEDGKKVLYARQFPKRAGYPEDPATGVAASALGSYLVTHQLLPISEGWNHFDIYQGEAMGKPSVIGSECFVEDGKITATRVCGSAELD